MDDIIETFLLGTLLFCPFGLLGLLSGMGTQAAVRRGRGVSAALTFLPIQTLFFFVVFVPSWDSGEPYPWCPAYGLCLAAAAAYLASVVFTSYAVIRYGKKKTSIGAAVAVVLLILLMVALGYYFRNMS